jgi:hypothetical protein
MNQLINQWSEVVSKAVSNCTRAQGDSDSCIDRRHQTEYTYVHIYDAHEDGCVAIPLTNNEQKIPQGSDRTNHTLPSSLNPIVVVVVDGELAPLQLANALGAHTPTPPVNAPRWPQPVLFGNATTLGAINEQYTVLQMQARCSPRISRIILCLRSQCTDRLWHERRFRKALQFQLNASVTAERVLESTPY